MAERERKVWTIGLFTASPRSWNCILATQCHNTHLVKVNGGEAKGEEKIPSCCQYWTSTLDAHSSYRLPYARVPRSTHKRGCGCTFVVWPSSAVRFWTRHPEVSALPVWTSYCYACPPHIFKHIWGLSIIIRCHPNLSKAEDWKWPKIHFLILSYDYSSGSLFLILWIWIIKHLNVHFCIQFLGGSVTAYLYSWSVAMLLKSFW